MAEESQLQKLILDWLAAKHILAFRMNTGTARYSDRYVAFGVKGMADVLAFQEHWRGVRAGFGIIPVWIECKSKRGQQSAFQKSFQKQVEEAGHRYIVAKSLDDVIAALEG